MKVVYSRYDNFRLPYGIASSPYDESLVDEHQISINTPYKYNAKELDDETGNYYYGARYYDPKYSFWLSVDPLADKYPSYSPYNFVLNNPIRFIDPDGKAPMDSWRLNTATGQLTKVDDFGGAKTQYVYLNNDNICALQYKGSHAPFVGPVARNTRSNGFTFQASPYNVWETVPKHYFGYYNAIDLAARFRIQEKSRAGYVIGSLYFNMIKNWEEECATRSQMYWSASEYKSYLNRNYGDDSGIVAGYDMGVLDMTIPGAGIVGGLSRSLKSVKQFGDRPARLNTIIKNGKSNMINLKSFGGYGSQNGNSWIRFLKNNKGRYKGKNFSWIRQARRDYIKNKNLRL